MDMAELVSQGRITFPKEYKQCKQDACQGTAGLAEYIPSTGRIALFICTTNPDHKWYACIDCKTPRRWKVIATARRHERKEHSQSEYRQPSDFLPASSMPQPDNKFLAQAIKRVEFGRMESKEFFLHEANGKGVASLVARSMNGDATATGNLDDDSIKFHMGLAHFSNTLTRSQTTEFAGILQSIQKRYVDIADDAATKESVAKRPKTTSSSESRSSKFASFIRQDLPTSQADFRRRYLEGKNSIVQNLPHPHIEMLDGKVGYASVIDCLRDFMANGNTLQVLLGDSFDGGSVTRLEESQCAAKVYKTCSTQGETSLSEQMVTCTSFLLEWFDDCEPNSNIKNNRGSVSLKTVTFGQPKTKSNDLRYTYLIAVGPKGETETIADKRFVQELELLRKGVVTYSRTDKQNVLVKMDLLAVLADQVARRGVTGISLGNGTFAARWGYAADVTAMHNQLPSCNACASALSDTHVDSGNCKQCLNWEFEDAPNPKLLETIAPKDFPADATFPASTENGSGNAAFLRPMKISFELLRDSIKQAHDKVVLAEWTQAEAKEFLRSRCLDTDTILKVLRNASNVRQYECAKSEQDDGQLQRNHFATIEHIRQQNPDHFEMYPGKACWGKGVEIENHIDVLMHLLYLGLTRTVLETIHDFLVRKNKLTTFLGRVAGRLEAIDALGLYWARLQGYRKGTFGGWISENYLDFTRFMKWFFSDMTDLLSEPAFIEPRHKQQKDWLKVENEGWLQSRGLPTTGKADELRQRVKEFMEQQGGPPPRLEDVDVREHEMLLLLDTFQNVIETSMAREVTEEVTEILSVRIKIFLNCFTRIDKKLNQKKKPTWIRTYNFMSLLNLPAAMKLYGPLVNLWEGKLMGEAIIKHCKSELDNGLRGNWAVSVLLKHYRKRALKQLTEEDIDNDDLDADDGDELVQKGKGRRAFKRYDSFFDVQGAFSSDVPLSAVCWSDGNDTGRFYGMAYGRKGEFVRELRPKDFTDTGKNGLTYREWEVTGNTLEIVQTDGLLPILLLPMLGVNRKGYYTVVSSEWKPFSWIS